jgi:hypothetical protein
MPNCDFYATLEDHEGLLSWLFAEDACHIYELSSDFERPLQRFDSVAKVLAQFNRCHVTGEKWTSVYLQLYVLGAGPPFTPRRVSLNPTLCNGATFRYAADGWGLVQLYLRAPARNGLEGSHTNHFTQKKAEAWTPVISDKPGSGSWDFKKITAFSSRLNREIRKRSVGKLGSRAVLLGAFELWQSGVSLLPYKPSDLSVKLKADA